LRPETKAQRDKGAKIGEADIAEARARAAALSEPGKTLDQNGEVVTVSAATARALLEATNEK